MDEIWNLKVDYSLYGLSANPFSINPLFSDYNDKEKCEKDKSLFVAFKEAKNAVISLELGRRIMVWGDIGVGKTSLLNMLLFQARFRDNFFPIRVVIKEENVERPIYELFHTYCYTLIEELRKKSILHPVESAKKWLLEKRYSDQLYDLLFKMMGPFEEEKILEEKVSTKEGVTIPIELGAEQERAVTKSLKSYVEALPSKMIESHLRELAGLVKELGFNGTVFALDEADHIPRVDKVISMLTTSREVFFSSPVIAFLVAGSPELMAQDKRGEIAGIFDVTIPVRPFDISSLKDVFLRRITNINSNLELEEVFNHSTITTIHKFSRGVVKMALKYAEGSLSEAATNREKPVMPKHVNACVERINHQILIKLNQRERKILASLQRMGPSSPSDKKLQTKTKLSRQRLVQILENLYKDGFVDRFQDGKKVLYKVYPFIGRFLKE